MASDLGINNDKGQQPRTSKVHLEPRKKSTATATTTTTTSGPPIQPPQGDSNGQDDSQTAAGLARGLEKFQKAVAESPNADAGLNNASTMRFLGMSLRKLIKDQEATNKQLQQMESNQMWLMRKIADQFHIQEPPLSLDGDPLFHI